MAASLNRAGFDVIAPDWIGHGDSEHFGDPQAYSLDAYMNCLAAIIRHCHGPQTHYVGVSWGAGMLFLYLLARKVLPQSATFVDVVLRSSLRRGTPLLMYNEHGDREFASAAEANALMAEHWPDFTQVPENFKSYLDKERYARRGGGVGFNFDLAVLPTARAVIEQDFDYVSSLKRVQFNALFLFGKESPYRLPFEFMTACARAPNIHYRDDLPGAHPPMLLHENQFRHVTSFIERSNSLR